MKKTQLISLVIFLLLAVPVLVNLVTISTFPSWFDEAFFANISFNLAQGHGLILDLIPDYHQGEVLYYGPIYFYLQAFLIDLFELHNVVFRLPNLLAGYISVFLFTKVLRNNHVPWAYCLFFIVAVVLDVSVNRNMVSGRMDMIALALTLAALLIVSLKPTRSASYEYFSWLLVGGLCAAAFLTTPRALFLFPVLLVLGIHRLFFAEGKPDHLQSFKVLALATLVFLLPIWLWVEYVGGVNAYVSLFTDTESMSQHIAPSFFRSSYDNLGISLMLVLVLANLRIALHNKLILGLMLTYLSFSIFVREVGPYAGMIMPFVLATIVLLLAELNCLPKVKYLVLLVLILPASLLVGLRGVDLALNAECRQNYELESMVNRFVHEARFVVAPFKYYFMLEESDRDLFSSDFLTHSDKDKKFFDSADWVFSAADRSVGLDSSSFEKVASLSCSPIRVALLPDSFYRRSVFSEILYQK